MDDEPFVSAVVELNEDAPGPEEPVVEDPTGVAMEAAAMLAGASLEPVPEAAPGPSGSAASRSSGSSANTIAKTKGFFTRAGFEVHAPVGMTFSIAAGQSAFEEFFDEQLAVDQETLGSPVTTADGGQDLPLDKLPDEIRAMVRRVYFMPPPDIPLGL